MPDVIRMDQEVPDAVARSRECQGWNVVPDDRGGLGVQSDDSAGQSVPRPPSRVREGKPANHHLGRRVGTLLGQWRR